jgi:hypothetical protein
MTGGDIETVFSELYQTNDISKVDLGKFRNIFFTNSSVSLKNELLCLFYFIKFHKSLFGDDKLLKNSLLLIAGFLPNARKFLSKISMNAIEESSVETPKLYSCYEVFAKKHKHELKNSIMSVFIVNSLIENNPSEVYDLSEHYTLVFKLIIHVYLNNKLENMVSVSNNDDEKLYIYDSRINFYTKMLSKCQLKNNVIRRDHSADVYQDNFLNFIKTLFNIENIDDKMISELKKIYPTVFNLFVYIESKSDSDNESYSFSEREINMLIRKTEDVCIPLLKKYLKDNVAVGFCRSMSSEISKIFTNKVFIDISRLNYVNINFTKVKKEFPELIVHILQIIFEK